MNSSVKRVDFLDHLRGVAILAVLLVHTLTPVFGYDELPWAGWFRDFSSRPFSFLCFFPLTFGEAGVPIFFIVSGFCIHMSFQQQGQRWGGFFIRRIFRIYPAYLAALIFIALLNAEQLRWNFAGQGAWLQLSTHLFLIHNFHPLTFMGINGSLWSLAIEAQLYLLYPALLVLVARLGWRRTMVILAGCELLIRGTDGLMQMAGAANTMGGQISGLFARSPLGYWFSWALGAFIADAFLKKQPLPFAKTSPGWWLALAIGSYFLKPLYCFRFLLFAVVTAVLVSRLLSGAKLETRIPKFSLDLLRRTGLWSYSIYLLHQPLFLLYCNISNWIVPEEQRSVPVAFLLVLATLLIIIPFSILWYKLFELPGIALGKQIIRKADLHHRIKVEPERSPENAPGRMPKGRYCLMSGALLVFIVGSFLVSAKLVPPAPAENNNLAWALATDLDATKRNGELAVKLAEDACQRTHYQVTIMVGTLAAAYAEAGRFDDAVLTAQQACKLAEKNGETNLLRKNMELLVGYQNHQPYRERRAGPPR